MHLAPDRSLPGSHAPDLESFFFRFALFIRLGAFVVINLLMFEGELQHPDSGFYHDQAAALVEGRSGSGVWELLTNKGGYTVLVAGMYVAGGIHPLLAALTNAVAGAAAVAIGYRLARSVFGTTTARTAGFLLALDPVQVYWSTQLLKDTLATLATLLAIAVLFSPGRVRGRDVLLLLMGLLVLLALRPELAFATMILLAFFGMRSRGRPVSAVAALSVALAAFFTTSVASWWSAFGTESSTDPAAVVQFVDNVRVSSNVESHVGFYDDSVPKSVFGSVSGLAVGILRSPFYYLFAPFVWEARSPYELLYAIPGLWWYAIGISGIVGMVIARRHKQARALMAFVVFLGLPIAVLFTSTAALARWRLQSAFLMGLFSAHAFAAFRAKREEERVTFANVQLVGQERMSDSRAARVEEVR